MIESWEKIGGGSLNTLSSPFLSRREWTSHDALHIFDAKTAVDFSPQSVHDACLPAPDFDRKKRNSTRLFILIFVVHLMSQKSEIGATFEDPPVAHNQWRHITYLWFHATLLVWNSLWYVWYLMYEALRTTFPARSSRLTTTRKKKKRHRTFATRLSSSTCNHDRF